MGAWRAHGEFYQSVLQAQAEGDETHVRFLLDGAELTVFDSAGMETMAPGSTRNAGRGGYTIEIEVSDVDAEYERLRNLGVTFVKLPTTQPWGRRSVWFRDLDGNIVNFYANVDREIASLGPAKASGRRP